MNTKIVKKTQDTTIYCDNVQQPTMKTNLQKTSNVANAKHKNNMNSSMLVKRKTDTKTNQINQCYYS